MDPRTIAYTLNQIADFLELNGSNRFKSVAYRNAARAVLELDTDDVRPLLRSGELAAVRGVGPAILSVITDLAENGESRYLEQLRARTPEGLVEMLRIPRLGIAKIHTIHDALGVESVDELEEAAHDGRLAALPRFGPRTAERILRGIATMRRRSAYELAHRAWTEARRLCASVERHPGVVRAMVAGSLRRRCEVVRDIDVVAACQESPARVAASVARAPGVREATGVGTGSVGLRYVDGTRLHLHCVSPDRFAVALWRATGSAAHERDVRSHAASRGIVIEGDELVVDGRARLVPDEVAFYEALGLSYIEPELREGTGEVPAAAAGRLPSLVTARDIRGVLHCHSEWSDGTTSITELALAARARGWEYLGISDHSQAAFYAGGMSPDAVRAQHDEIDRVNAELTDIRVLKGIEADILPDGRVDYDAAVLDRFDYVIASVHSRFGMDRETMTARVLRALDDPHVTVLGHPTGRLLLTREPYALDIDAVLEKAATVGVAVELNADPYRLDLDWHHCQRAKQRGCTIAIGPDAHSVRGLDAVEGGIDVARKGWLEPRDVLNSRRVDEVVRRARRRRAAA